VAGAAVSGVTGSILSGTNFARGQVVTVVATPDDGSLSGSPVVGNSVTIQNAPPTAPVVSITPSTPQDADDLVCSVTTPSTDADGDAVTYSFEWTKNGQPFSGASSTSATSSTISGSATSMDDTYTCRVSGSDGTTSTTSSPAAAELTNWVTQFELNFDNGSISPLFPCIGCSGLGCPTATAGELLLPGDWNVVCGQPSDSNITTLDTKVVFDITSLGNSDAGICFGHDGDGRWCVDRTYTTCVVGGVPTTLPTGASLSVGTWTFERRGGVARLIDPNGSVVASQTCEFSMTFFRLDATSPQAGTPVNRRIDNLKWMTR
jgi:hypothetical protein